MVEDFIVDESSRKIGRHSFQLLQSKAQIDIFLKEEINKGVNIWMLKGADVVEEVNTFFYEG